MLTTFPCIDISSSADAGAGGPGFCAHTDAMVINENAQRNAIDTMLRDNLNI